MVFNYKLFSSKNDPSTHNYNFNETLPLLSTADLNLYFESLSSIDPVSPTIDRESKDPFQFTEDFYIFIDTFLIEHFSSRNNLNSENYYTTYIDTSPSTDNITINIDLTLHHDCSPPINGFNIHLNVILDENN